MPKPGIQGRSFELHLLVLSEKELGVRPGTAIHTESAKTIIVVMKANCFIVSSCPGEEQEHESRHRRQEDDQTHQHGGVGEGFE